MADRLTDRELQSLRNLGGLAEQAADEIAASRAQAPAEGDKLSERKAFAAQEFAATMADSSRAHFLQTGEPPYYLHDAWVAWQARAALGPKVQPKGTTEGEVERLRAAQTAAVMPLIGPLLDAWENADREVMDDEPELAKWLKAINTAMETAGDDEPAPQPRYGADDIDDNLWDERDE